MMLTHCREGVVSDYQPFVTESGADIYIPAVHEGLPVIGISDFAFYSNELDNIIIGYADTPIRILSYVFHFFQGTTITINRELLFSDDYGNKSKIVFTSMAAATVILPERRNRQERACIRFRIYTKSFKMFGIS